MAMLYRGYVIQQPTLHEFEVYLQHTCVGSFGSLSNAQGFIEEQPDNTLARQSVLNQCIINEHKEYTIQVMTGIIGPTVIKEAVVYARNRVEAERIAAIGVKDIFMLACFVGDSNVSLPMSRAWLWES